MAGSRASTRAAALQLVAYFVAGMRLATLIQMAPSLVPAVTTGDHRALTAVTWAVAATALVGLTLIVLVRRRPTGARYAVVDVAIAVALLVAGTWTVPVDQRLGTWVGFQAGYALCVACSLAGVRSRGWWVALLLTLTAAEAFYLAATVERWVDAPHLVGNVLTIVLIGALAWVGARMLVRIASEADQMRALAAEAAKADEERRARTAIHNGAAVMRLLVETGAQGDQVPELWQQAEAELNRMRAYLAGTPLPARGGSTSLAAVVTAASVEFADLPITVVADLAEGVVVERELADDLGAALRSLLLNVRLHAGAAQIVLHAEEHEDGRGWEVSLHDDGVGFEAGRTSYGVGIRDVVVGQLSPWGIESTIDSVPEIGTTVTLVRTGEV